MILEKKRVQILLFISGIIVLSFTAEKCRELVGFEAASKSGEFTFLNCFDGGSGTVACLVKEGVKLYFYNIRSTHVEIARNRAIEMALAGAISQGASAKDAAKQAQKEGAKAAKLAVRQTKRIVGPIISSGWDFFEALYFGGTMTEAFLRGTGTLVGAYSIGFIGEQKFGRFGYLVGSHLGSWVGGRIGLMVYDVVNGVHFFLEFSQSEESKSYDGSSNGDSDRTTAYKLSEDSPIEETPTSMTSEFSEETNAYDAAVNEDSGVSELSEEISAYDAAVNEDSGIHEEF